MHRKPTEEGASALDTLFCVHLKAVVVEELSRCKAHVARDSRGAQIRKADSTI